MLLELFISFAKIGAFTLGGGYAMVPLIQSEVVDKKGWIQKDEFVDILAVAQSTPGALAVNMAAFIGYKTKGVIGAAAATFGCIIPSFISILIIAIFFNKFMNYQIVKRAFMGIRPAVAALIAFSVYKIAKTSSIKISWYSIAIAAFVLVVFLKVDPIAIILASGVTGALIGFISKNHAGGDAGDI